MRILQLTTRFRIGGIASYIALLAKGLSTRGHRVCIAGSPGSAESTMEGLDIPFIPLDINVKSEVHPKLWKAAQKLDHVVQTESIELIHAHTRVTQVLASWVCSKLSIPFVSTCHGFYPLRLGRRLFPCWGDVVIAISPQVKDHLVNVLRVPEDRIRVVLNAIPFESLQESKERMDRRAIRSAWGISESDLVLTTTSRIERVKGHECLMRALERLKEDRKRLKWLVTGSGSDESRIRDLAVQLNVSDQIVFAGELVNVGQALAATDLFISPQTWEEGFGLSIAEAMAWGLPVIASSTGAVTYFMRHGLDGWLVKPGDAEELAQAIRTLGNDGLLRGSLGRAARETARKEFSDERAVGALEEIYGRLIGAPRRKANQTSVAQVG